MSDLCAPLYVVMGGDEEMTFWCFVRVMERMVGAAGFISATMASDTDGWLNRNRTSFAIRAG